MYGQIVMSKQEAVERGLRPAIITVNADTEVEFVLPSGSISVSIRNGGLRVNNDDGLLIAPLAGNGVWITHAKKAKVTKGEQPQ